jgi:ribosomal protein S18 acetylase RimI-like enzyme
LRIRPLAFDDFGALLDYDWTPLVAERDTIYLFLCRDHASCSFVAEDEDGNALGYLVGGRSADGESVFLFHLHVRRAHRRRGIGTALMRKMEDVAANGGVETVWLLARDRAERFYARLGYSERISDLPGVVLRHVQHVKATKIFEKSISAKGVQSST